MMEKWKETIQRQGSNMANEELKSKRLEEALDKARGKVGVYLAQQHLSDP